MAMRVSRYRIILAYHWVFMLE